MRNIPILLLVLSLGLGAHGQTEGESREKRAAQISQKMAEALDLTEEQAADVLEANLELAEAMRENEAVRKALMEAHQAKMKAVLSEEQYAQYLKMLEERRSKRRSRK